jgi:hypothetical protein
MERRGGRGEVIRKEGVRGFASAAREHPGSPELVPAAHPHQRVSAGGKVDVPDNDFAHLLPCHHDHLDSRPLFEQVSAKVQAVEPGHLHVSDHQIYCSRILARNLQPLLAIGRGEDDMPFSLQQNRHQIPNHHLVLSHENDRLLHAQGVEIGQIGF